LFGPTYGIFINALIYVPMFVWLMKAPYGRGAPDWRPGGAVKGLRRYLGHHEGGGEESRAAVHDGADRRSAFFVGNAYQAQMPGFARRSGHGRRGFFLQHAAGGRCAGGWSAA
jgi:hypothetical protein